MSDYNDNPQGPNQPTYPGGYYNPGPGVPQQGSQNIQYPPTRPYVPSASDFQGPPKKSNVRNFIFYGIVVALLLGIGITGWYIASNTILKDSGIAACEAMANKVKDNKTIDGDNNKKMTQKEYDELRKLFAKSRHKDIREPGVHLIDFIWNLQNTKEEDQLGAAFLSMGNMMRDISDLQTGCKNHGIQVNLMNG